MAILRLRTVDLRPATLWETGTTGRAALWAKLRAILWATLVLWSALMPGLGSALLMSLRAAWTAMLRAVLAGTAGVHAALAGIVLTGATLGRAIGPLTARAGPTAGRWGLEVSLLLILLIIIGSGVRRRRLGPCGDSGERGKNQSAAK